MTRKFHRFFTKGFNDLAINTSQKMKFSIKGFFSKYDQIHKELRNCTFYALFERGYYFLQY